EQHISPAGAPASSGARTDCFRVDGASNSSERPLCPGQHCTGSGKSYDPRPSGTRAQKPYTAARCCRHKPASAFDRTQFAQPGSAQCAAERSERSYFYALSSLSDSPGVYEPFRPDGGYGESGGKLSAQPGFDGWRDLFQQYAD